MKRPLIGAKRLLYAFSMLLDISLLLFALVLILVSSELFTNGVEWLGLKLHLSEGVVGSVLAAVGTALPETLIPFIAVLFFPSQHGHEVGIGAIAGAPFMLSTLTLSMCGTAMWYYTKRGRRQAEMKIKNVVLRRDLKFFIYAYALAVVASFASDYAAVKWLIALTLVGIYPLYLYQTFRHEGEVGEAPEHLHLDRILKTGSTKLRMIVAQVLLGLGGIIGGAFIFVENVQDLATAMGVPTVILSLIIAPVATELPEKVNSVLWARQGKDTLAMGNITGALVFQSCFPVAFGVAFTHWQLSIGTLATAVVALCAAGTYLFLLEKRRLSPQHLMFGAIAYGATIWFLIATGMAPTGH